MADRTNYLMPAPPARNLNALSSSWRAPSLQDVVAVAAYGDARQNARIREKIREMRLQDEMARRQGAAPRRNLPNPPWRGPTPATSSAPIRRGRRPPREVTLDRVTASATFPPPDKIERSAGRRKPRGKTMNLRSKHALVYDLGLFTENALRLLRDCASVKYFVPWVDAFPEPFKAKIGEGLDGMERVNSFEEHLDGADFIFVPDTLCAGLVEWLKKHDYPVAGRRGRGKTGAEPLVRPDETKGERSARPGDAPRQGRHGPAQVHQGPQELLHQD